MSTATTIADLLLRQGQSNANRVAQQGQIWGTALSNIGQQIASIPAQQQQQRAMNQRNVLGDLQIQEARGELSDKEKARQKSAAVDAVLAKYDNIEEAIPELMRADPKTGAAIYKEVLAAKKEGLAIRGQEIKNEGEKAQIIASELGSVSDQGTHTRALFKLSHAFPDYNWSQFSGDYEADKPLIKSTVQGAISAKDQATLKMQQEEKDAKKPLLDAQTAEANARVPLIGAQAAEANARVPLIGAQASEASARVPLISAQTAEAKARLPLIGAQTKAANASATKAVDPLVKVEHKDPTTGRTVIEWLPKSQLEGKTFEKGTSATLDTRLASAQAVNQTGNDIIGQLRDPKVAAVVGPAMGRVSTLRDFIGNPPPELSQLAGSIESYALANMGVHGMRSAEAAEKIKRMLDAHHSPESLIAAIEGLQKFSVHLLENEGRQVPQATPATPKKNPYR